MTAQPEHTVQWKTTIVINTSLQHHDTSRRLLAQQHRVRFSDNVAPGAFVFPAAGTAFLVVHLQELPENAVNKARLLERVGHFVHIHRNGFLLLCAPLHGKRELDTLSDLQQRLFGCNLRILPVQNDAEIVDAMLKISKVTSKPHVDIIRNRLSVAREHIIEDSPVWKMLSDMKLG